MEMKMLDIIKESENDMENITITPLIFSLIGPENCLVHLVKGTSFKQNNLRGKQFRNLYKLHVELFLDDLKLRKEIFQEIIEGTLYVLKQRGLEKLNELDDIELSFERITLHFGDIKFELFDYISRNNLTEIKQPRSIVLLLSDESNYNFITDNVLPIIHLDYHKEYILKIKRAKDIYKIFRKGKINGISYTLDDYFKMEVLHDNKKFDFENRIITPHFKIVFFTHDPDIQNEDDLENVMEGISNRFHNMGIFILFR